MLSLQILFVHKQAILQTKDIYILQLFNAYFH